MALGYQTTRGRSGAGRPRLEARPMRAMFITWTLILITGVAMYSIIGLAHN
jgi:hypothetical protein